MAPATMMRIAHSVFVSRSALLWLKTGLFLTILLAACSTSSSVPASQVQPRSAGTSLTSTGGTTDRSIATRGCGRAAPVPPGQSANQTLTVNPAESEGVGRRLYRLHVPITYQVNSPTPLVLVFHGAGGTSAGMESGTGLSTFADQHGFLVAYPQGLPDGPGESSFWASVGPMDFGVDDVHYVSLLLDDLQKNLCVDVRRIFVTGFSNGGGMSGLLACRLASRLAAVAPVSGNFYAIPGGCHPSRPLPLLDIHGSADPLLLYNGIPASEDPPWPLPPIQQWLQGWVTLDGCNSGPAIFARTPQIMGERWTGCQGDAIVEHYRVEGGGHSWPRMLGSRPTLDVMWSFFEAHPLPEAPSGA
jgi:polyhydroxybutyrate depolymerase